VRRELDGPGRVCRRQHEALLEGSLSLAPGATLVGVEVAAHPPSSCGQALERKGGEALARVCEHPVLILEESTLDLLPLPDVPRS
jgi:hypothetical protein